MTLKPFQLALFLSGLIGTAYGSDTPSPAARLEAIQKEVADAESAFRQAVTTLPDSLEGRRQRSKLHRILIKKREVLFEEALQIARADPKSDTAFDALEWLLKSYTGALPPIAKPALDLLAKHHAANPKIGKRVAIMGRFFSSRLGPQFNEVVALLQNVAEKNPKRSIRAQAAIGFAWIAKDKFRIAESHFSPDADRLASEAEKAFEGVVRDYGDCPSFLGKHPTMDTLAQEIQPELYELRHLRIGMQAMDIAGEDLRGIPFKLSDYRGKVILLVFWASWCGPCMGAVPHERELVEHFKCRPFILVGVNGDSTTDRANKAVEKHRISWRSFWNGRYGHQGGIAADWNVHGWPTVYVMDHQGVIRHKYLQGKRLDEPLEKLVAEAETAAKKKSSK